MTASAWWQPFLGPAATLVAIPLAALIGVRSALPKLKRERAFDRRREWYENIVIALNDLRNEMLFSRVKVDAGEPPDEAAFEQAKKRLYLLVPQSHLFAKPESVAAVYKVIRAIELGAVHMQGNPKSQKFKAAEKVILDITRVAARRLAEETRRHMGDEPLAALPGDDDIKKILDGPAGNV